LLNLIFPEDTKSNLNGAEEVNGRLITIVMLKWVHIAISNAKRNFLGVYHKINGEYLQKYLDEFVYKHNRRYFKSIFERLVVASVYPYWQTNEESIK
jgi:hypothetical protein